jgi:hypothetical protein
MKNAVAKKTKHDLQIQADVYPAVGRYTDSDRQFVKRHETHHVRQHLLGKNSYYFFDNSIQQSLLAYRIIKTKVTMPLA